jgi:hypothetical protein
MPISWYDQRMEYCSSIIYAKLRHHHTEKPFNDPCNYHAREGTREFGRGATCGTNKFGERPLLATSIIKHRLSTA